MKKYKKNLLLILRGLLVFLLFKFSAYLQLIPIYLFKINLNSLSGGMEVCLSTFSSVIVMIILSIIYFKDLKIEFKKFRENLMENLDVGFKCWFIGLVIIVVSNYILLIAFKSGGANNENLVQDMIQALPWLMLIDAGIIAPFNEELVFRKTLKDVFKNKWIFVGLSFLLFGAVHVINQATCLVDYLYIGPYGALGGAFALAYYKTDTVFTTIALHIFHNTVLTLVSIFL